MGDKTITIMNQFNIKPFRRVWIGEKDILKKWENGKAPKEVKECSFHFDSIPFSNRVAGVQIQEEKSELTGDLEYKEYHLIFFSVKKDSWYQRIIEAECDRKCYPQLVKQSASCSGQRYELYVDDKHKRLSDFQNELFWFGSQYKNNNAFVFDLVFDAKNYSYKDILKLANSLFVKQDKGYFS